MRTKLLPFGIVIVASLLVCLSSVQAERPTRPLAHSDTPDLPRAPDELAQVLEVIQPGAYVVVETDRVTLDVGAVSPIGVFDGLVHLYGEVVVEGEELATGLYVVLEPLEIAEGADDPDPIRLAAGDILAVVGPVAQEGTVTCKTGYFACCYIEKNSGGKKKAKCRPDGSDDADCDAGGVGSSSCGWNADMIDSFAPVDP